MDDDELRRRVIDQFSYRGEHADIWRGFDLFLNTNAFLNLGYSPWYQPHVLGSSQLRLTRKMGRDVAALVDRTDGIPLLDVGCGRGGPSLHLAAAHGFDVTGVDLVPYNVELAVRNAARRNVDAAFAIGDATHLPFRADSFAVSTAIDSGVYIRDKRSFFSDVATVLRPGGIVALSDLVTTNDLDTTDQRSLKAFTDAWDFAPLEPIESYRTELEATGFDIVAVEDISRNSTDRLRKWARLYLAVERYLVCDPVARFFQRRGIDPAAVAEQVRAAYRALPLLRHVIVYARR